MPESWKCLVLPSWNLVKQSIIMIKVDKLWYVSSVAGLFLLVSLLHIRLADFPFEDSVQFTRQRTGHFATTLHLVIGIPTPRMLKQLYKNN